MLIYAVGAFLVLFGVSASACQEAVCPKYGVALLPITSDCSSFISCVNGEEYRRQCPDSLKFDVNLKICTFAEIAECAKCDDSEKTMLPIKSVFRGFEQKANNISQRCIDNSVTPVTCPANMDDDRLLPHPDDCGLFYYCPYENLAPICRECPANLHFNPNKKVCDHPETAGCIQYSKTKLPTVSANKQQTVDKLVLKSPTTFNNISENCKANSITPVECGTDLTDDRLLPHPDDCRLFYYCVGPNLPPICRECPNNLHFNPVKKVCDYPETAGCLSKKERLMFTEYLKCEQNNGIYADLRPDPENCNKYYVCDWNLLIPMSCPEGLHFNAVSKVCESPYTANCPLFVPKADNFKDILRRMSRLEDLDESNESKSSEETLNESNESKSAEEEQEKADKVKCRTDDNSGSVELLPDPESCESFYICSWGVPYLTDCPPRLHFNPTLLVCDYPYRAGCTLAR